MAKTSLKKLWFIVSLTGIIFSTAILVCLNSSWFAHNFYPKSAAAAGSQIKIVLAPRYLKIPAINVDVKLEQVGLTSQGAVGVPRSPVNAAWFNLGPRPGDNGSAVLVGHYGRWKNGQVGAFNNLSKLRKGDKLYVENTKGSTTVFVVREFRTYDKNADTSDIFNSDDTVAHLNLITCEGTWDKVSKSYSRRLVIFADKK